MKRSRAGKTGVRIPGTKKKGKQPKQVRTSGPQPLVITHRNLFPKGSFAKAGGMLGSIFGPKGAAVGSTAGAMLSRITGVGDYKVKSNSIMTDTASFSGEVPAFGKTDNSTRVRHREFVMDVTMNATPSAFRNTSYVIQPSNATLFPWLSSLAQNYQQYRLHGCVFVFKSTTSDYSAAGALGKVAMATNYNVRDSDFINMQELENAEFSVSGKPSLSRVHPIECASNNGVPLVKWVRDAQYDASGGDDRLYDVGKFQFATSGLPAGTANSVIGELWISYDIEFFKPIINRLPVQGQYEPVSVPVFDSYAGGPTANTSTSSLFMMESSYADKPPSGWPTRADAIYALRNPGSYVRNYIGQPDEPYGQARVTRSAFRADPDPATDPTGSYPAYWESTSTLVLQRKGVYAIKQFAQMMPRISGTAPVQRTDPAVALNTANSGGLVPNNMTDAQKDLLARVETDGPSGSYYVLHTSVPSSALTYGQPGDTHQYGARDIHKLRSTTINWEAVIWVKEDHPAGDGVKVKFFDDVNFASDRTSNIGMQWGGNNSFDINNLVYFGFQVSFLSASMATYYQPVVQGLTNDDKKSLKDSVSTVEALLPKLRELGLL